MDCWREIFYGLDALPELNQQRHVCCVYTLINFVAFLSRVSATCAVPYRIHWRQCT